MRSNQRVWRLDEIAARLGGEVMGDPATGVSHVAPIERAAAGSISFVTGVKFLGALKACSASAVVVPPTMAGETALPRIVHPNPYLYYARLVALLHADPIPAPGIHPSAVVESPVPASVWVGANVVIGRDVVIGEGVRISPGVVIGDGASVGEDSLLHANVTIYADCVVGARAVIHSGAVIGSDGFGFAKDGDAWVKIPQVGRVLIGDDVEIGANTAIDRGALDDTVIGDCVKLDNLVHIAHNIKIGDFTAIAGCVGMAGSTSIGSKCTVGGGALIVGHIEIADGVNVSGGTVVTKSIAEKGTYTGFFPIDDHLSWMKNAAQIRHLGETQKRVRALEKALLAQSPAAHKNNP